MEIRSDSFTFEARSGFGPQTDDREIVFSRPVTVATAAIAAYALAFDQDDHEVGKLQVRLETEINGNVVIVKASLGLRDWSGNWDDRYGGRIDFVLLADLEDAALPPPRRDLVVSGVEFNQATQYFRSNRYLDGVNTRPDNSMPLSARKATGVRVFLDHDAAAGLLPQLTALDGTLTVRTQTGQFEIAALNGGLVTPRRDNQINQSNPDHTLNFAIPGAWCVDEIDISIDCFQSGDPAQRATPFGRTLQFHDVPVLDIYTVGIHYTGQGLDIAAPAQNDVIDDFVDMEAMFPQGTINVTGFSEMDFGDDLAGNLGNGCGTGWSAILDDLDDLKGDSADIYVAQLPNGPNGGGVGGCGSRSNGVCVVFTNDPISLAHEVGHALGRRHTPCPACGTPPRNADDDYPQYGNFPRDSVGVFGFRPDTGDVFDPATTGDLMSYNSARWISPYTYNALKGGGGGGSSEAAGPEPEIRQNLLTEVLHLGLEIDRHEIVTRRPSFHYETIYKGGSDHGHYCIEILDEWGAVRSRETFGGHGCGCGGGCEDGGPVSFRGRLVFPKGARFLEIWHGERRIYRETIPPEPVVAVQSKEPEREGIRVSWEAYSRQDKRRIHCAWYLVQWFDAARKSWRGVAARQQEPTIVVPYRLFGRDKALRLRILATTGISTGMTEIELAAEDRREPAAKVTVHVRKLTRAAEAGDQAAAKGRRGGSRRTALKLYAVDELGRAQPSLEDAAWYGAKGEKLGRGAVLSIDSTRCDPAGIELVVDHPGSLIPARLSASGAAVKPPSAKRPRSKAE